MGVKTAAARGRKLGRRPLLTVAGPYRLIYIKAMECNGFRLIPAALDAAEQGQLLDLVLNAAQAAPFYCPITPSGAPMSVQQSSFGPLGWITDARGYRYSPRHPLTGEPWPAMPQVLLDLWDRHAQSAARPDSGLINLYRGAARMGLHRDADEADQTAPVLSISLGDTAVFRLGGAKRSDPTTSLKLASGDICVLDGASRRAFHGVDRILQGSSRLVPGGGRINLTLRRAA